MIINIKGQPRLIISIRCFFRNRKMGWVLYALPAIMVEIDQYGKYVSFIWLFWGITIAYYEKDY